MSKLTPCRCGAYRFPHRASKKCGEYAQWLADDHYAAEKADNAAAKAAP